LTGWNTDLEGFRRAAEILGARQGTQAVVLGAGGSARAVIAGLLELGAEVTVVARRLPELVKLKLSMGWSVMSLPWDAPVVAEVVEQATLLVNTTPLGMSHLSDQNPLPAGVNLEASTMVMDLVYGRATLLLQQAGASGCRTMDGIEMLAQQGATAFGLFTGAEPD